MNKVTVAVARVYQQIVAKLKVDYVPRQYWSLFQNPVPRTHHSQQTWLSWTTVPNCYHSVVLTLSIILMTHTWTQFIHYTQYIKTQVSTAKLRSSCKRSALLNCLSYSTLPGLFTVTIIILILILVLVSWFLLTALPSSHCLITACLLTMILDHVFDLLSCLIKNC